MAHSFPTAARAAVRVLWVGYLVPPRSLHFRTVDAETLSRGSRIFSATSAAAAATSSGVRPARACKTENTARSRKTFSTGLPSEGSIFFGNLLRLRLMIFFTGHPLVT